MKHSLYALLFLLPLISSSQPYWQQQVDYKIDVSLNDTLHELDGFITIQYKNNSPAPLSYIYFHLWPNAYRNHSTPLAEQLLENGETKFHYSKPSQRGYMDKLDFKLNAEACIWKFDSALMEIAKINLNQPLQPGATVTISTPFHLRLPETFSRMGHVGQSYQITQWYPKPAVYDKNGWHQMPYLDQGEFYSEYGSFDVSITLPKNYVVGATGDLQDAAEIRWMTDKSDVTKKTDHFDEDDMKFPPSLKETKTLHYKQNNIHDFGWFADKRYHVLKGEVELPYSKRKVTTWALFTNNEADLWVKAPNYLHDAIYYYSLWIGEYPYAQVTAVDGTISAGGGMEYPNVTIIGEAKTPFTLDDIITHEVGHNWFYGILGSNERDHAWMDEGINSFYENRYVKTKYPKQGLSDKIPASIARILDIAQYKHKYRMDFGYQMMARENYDQPIDIHSAKFTKFNYGVLVYGKSALSFDYLEAYLGTEVFDRAMKKYFETWQYKHPQPEDIRAILEAETGKNLDWFFNDLLQTDKKVDYKLTKRLDDNEGKTVFELKNVGQVNSPVVVSVLKKDSVLSSTWLEGFAGKKQIELNMGNGDRVQIDPQLVVPEINRRNNTYIMNKAAHRFEKLRFQFIGSLENQNRTQVFFSPYFGWNNYDKTQIGLAIYSPIAPMRKFNYQLVPAFGTGSKNIIGFANFNYNFFFPQKVQQLTIGLAGKRFSNIIFPQNLMYNKIEPYLNIVFKKKKPRSPDTHSLNLRSVVVMLDWINFDGDKRMQKYYVNEARYRFERKTTLHPFNVTATLQQGKQFIGLWAEGNFKLSYKGKGQGFFARVFAGGFPLYTKSNSDIMSPLPRLYLSNATNPLAYWLQKDYMFDENFLDRNGRDKYLGRQVALTGGGFRSITTFGGTSNFLASANVSSTIIRFIPIRPFASMAMVLNDLNKVDFAAEMGLSLIIIPDIAEIHLPLVATKNITDGQQAAGITKWYQRFTFTLKVKLDKPLNIIRRFI